MKKLLVIMFTLITTIFAFGEEATITKTYSINNIKEFSLDTNRGNITIDSKDVDSISISYANLPNLQLKEDIDRDSIELKFKNKKDSFFGSKDKTKYNITITIPKSYVGEIELESINGNILANNLNSKVELNTVNGDITTNNLKNIDKAQSVNGDLKIKNSSLIDKIKNVNGDITVINNHSIKDIESVNGNININSKNFVRDGEIESVNGSINLTLDFLEGDNKIQTVNGKITIITPKDQINLTQYKKNSLQDKTRDITIKGRNINIHTK